MVMRASVAEEVGKEVVKLVSVCSFKDTEVEGSFVEVNWLV